MSEDDDLLAIAGLQHFAFCRRQWVLLPIESRWAENFPTADGTLMPEKAHDRERGSADQARGFVSVRRSREFPGNAMFGNIPGVRTASRRPAGRNCGSPIRWAALTWSLPHGECGLKLLVIIDCSGNKDVAPPAGAWMEIRQE